MTEIRQNDLRFTKEEVTSFLNNTMGLDLSLKEIEAIETRTEGWIASLQLASLSMQNHEGNKEFVASFSGNHHYIIDYLVEEVKSRQPEEIQSFLCQTSILDRFCAPLCDRLLKISNSRQILKKLEEANLFLIPLDDERCWYRYHHLFGDFLKHCLRENRHEQISKLHLRAAEWYEQNGFISDALSHLLAAENYAGAAGLVERNAKGMLERSEFAKLMKWVEKIPDEHLLMRPWLCIYHAWALRLSGSPYEIVESRIQSAERGLEKYNREPSQMKQENNSISSEKQARNLMGHIMALRTYQALYKEDIPSVIDLAERAITCHPEENFVWSSLGFAQGWAYRFSGDLQAAYQAFAEAKAVSLKSGNIYMAVATLCRAAYGQVMGGRLHQAIDSFQEAVDIASFEDGRQRPVAGYAYVYMGGVYHEWNDLDTAKRYLDQGIDLCKRVGFIMDQVIGYAYLSRVRIVQNDLAGAQEACQIAERLSQKMEGYVYVRRWVEDSQVRLWIAQGNFEAMEHWVSSCGLGVDDDLTFRRDIDHIILARALVALGREQPEYLYIEDASKLLTRLQGMAKTAGWNGKLIEILVLQALALQVRGDNERALDALERALSLAKPESYIRTFVDEGVPMEKMLGIAASRDITRDYVDKLLAAYEPGHVSRISLIAQSQIDPLSKRELEVLKLLQTELTGPEIARELTISLNTMRTHTKSIYSKLNVNNRRAAIREAREYSVI